MTTKPSISYVYNLEDGDNVDHVEGVDLVDLADIVDGVEKRRWGNEKTHKGGGGVWTILGQRESTQTHTGMQMFIKRW